MHLVQNAINKLVIQTSCQKISILFYYHHDLIIESCRVHVIYGVHKNHFSHVLNNKAFWLEMLIFIHMQIILMYCPSVLSILIPVLLKMKHQVSSAFVNDCKECGKVSGVVLLFINLSYINGCRLFINIKQHKKVKYLIELKQKFIACPSNMKTDSLLDRNDISFQCFLVSTIKQCLHLPFMGKKIITDVLRLLPYTSSLFDRNEGTFYTCIGGQK